jgi:outer membrane lipoprotein carrier protein
MKIWILSLLLALSAVAQAGAGRDAFEHFTHNLKTLDARFEQAVLDTENSRQGLFHGIFQMKRPGRFRWDYVSPEKRHIIADGRDLWIVEDDLNHVTQYLQSMALKGSPATLLLSQEPLDKQFKVIELGERQGLQWLELLPLEKDSGIVRVLVAFKGDDLTRLEVTDQFGQISRFSFFDIKRNIDLPDATFDYDPPDGWDVLKDLRG